MEKEKIPHEVEEYFSEHKLDYAYFKYNEIVYFNIPNKEIVQYTEDDIIQQWMKTNVIN